MNLQNDQKLQSQQIQNKVIKTLTQESQMVIDQETYQEKPEENSSKHQKYQDINYHYEQKNQDYIELEDASKVSEIIDQIPQKELDVDKNSIIKSDTQSKLNSQKQEKQQITHRVLQYKSPQKNIPIAQLLKFDYDSIYKNIKIKQNQQQQNQYQGIITNQKVQYRYNNNDLTTQNMQASMDLKQQKVGRYPNFFCHSSQKIKFHRNKIQSFFVDKSMMSSTKPQLEPLSSQKIGYLLKNKNYDFKESHKMIDKGLQTSFYKNHLTNITQQNKKQFLSKEQSNKKMIDEEQQTDTKLKSEKQGVQNKQTKANLSRDDSIQSEQIEKKIQKKTQQKYSKSNSFQLPKLVENTRQKNEIISKDKKNSQSNVQNISVALQIINTKKNSISNSNSVAKNQSNEQFQDLEGSEVTPKEFDFKIYIKIYSCLNSIQNNLKNADLLKSIKGYLELIASGKVDKIQNMRVPLHKKKILKNSLLYQRIAIIIVAFSFAADTLRDSYRYLSNLLKFAMDNHLIILKLLSLQYNKIIPQELNNELKELFNISNKQNTSKGYQILRDNNEILQQTIFRLSKYDNLFYQNLKKFIKNSSKFSIQQTFYFILEYFAFFLNICGISQKIPFLAVAPNPYLSPIQKKKYTLVIDFYDVLCNSKKPEFFRPYSQYFLDQMSEYYEIVVFSIAFPGQVNKIIENLDKKNRISHKLYKHHAIKSGDIYLKDLTRLGRDMSKIVLIDSQQEEYKLNKQNTISIHSWTGKSKDTALAQICPMLAMIVLKNMDVREALAKYKEQMIKNLDIGVKYINYGMNLN